MAGQLYKSASEYKDNYDAIVIGSGMGGLSVAALLSKAGKKVLVLEKHYIVGGYTHAFQRLGYKWDVGLHYVGQVHIKGTPLNKVFRYISDEKLEWAPLDDIYDRAVFGNKEYEFVKGEENFKAKLKEYFPAEKDVKSIDDYFALLEKVKNIGAAYYAEKVIPPFLSKLIGPLLRSQVLKYSDQTTLEVLNKITDNKTLIGVLTAQYGDYGLLPSQSSFYMHALLANHYMDGAGYPVGGADQIAETVVPVIEAAGGSVLFKADVKKIIIKDNKAVGVEMADGNNIYAKLIISDTGITHTFSELVPEEVAKKHGLLEKLKELEPSAAHIGLYAGIRESTKSLNLPACNYWIFPDQYDHDFGRNNYQNLDSEIPVTYVSFPSAKDPQARAKHPDQTLVEGVIIVPYEWFSKWENTEWKKRGEEYELMKKRVREMMFEKIFQVQPQLRGKIETFEISTPLSTKNFMNHKKGEIYGVAHTPKRFRQTFLKPHTPVKNLYLTGQDVMIASIAGALMGGVLCASAILTKDVLGDINRKIT